MLPPSPPPCPFPRRPPGPRGPPSSRHPFRPPLLACRPPVRRMSRPASPPIGLRLAQVAKAVSRTFDDALAEAGGSLPVWLILITLKSRQLANQRQLAAAVGIQGATLTHHLNAMESGGL